MFRAEGEERSEELQALVNETGDKVLELGKFKDYEFLAKLLPVALSLITIGMHEDTPCSTNEEEGKCEHQDQIRAMLSFAFTSGLMHRQYGPGELISVIKAAATAVALGVTEMGMELTPVAVLRQTEQGFSHSSWHEVKGELLDMVLRERDRVNGLVAAELAAEGGESTLPPEALEQLQKLLDELPTLDIEEGDARNN